jgi:beta-N-acetylhexosaminidase
MSDLARQAARMVCIGFDSKSITPEVEALIERGVGGVVLFSRNVESPQQFSELCADLKERAGRPFLTCIDQEGGRVQRLREPFTIIPPMRAVGAANDETLARELGRVLARELRAVNIDMDLAPVMDVDTNPDNPVIAARSFGRTPQLVARMGVAMIRGLQEEGVAACAKHFPGHGDTSQDSHFDLPALSHPIERLMSVEIPPFAAAIEAGVSAIMTAHVIFQPIDPQFPATMSQKVLDGLLRGKLGFDGPVISDAMDMKAIADHFGFDDAVVQAAAAGVDLLMLCHSHEQQNRAIDLLVKAAESDQLPRERLEQAGRRLDALYGRYVKPATRGALPPLIGSEMHRAVADQVLRRSDAASQAGGLDPTAPTDRGYRS